MTVHSAPAVRAARLIASLREQPVLVQVLTNIVAADVTANVLLAAGASPAMVHGLGEVNDFARIADAVTINIGTLDPGWVPSMMLAARSASAAGKPWVLDPVAAGATPWRTGVAVALSRLGVTAVRANASEVMALANAGGVAPRGVDSVHAPVQALPAAESLASVLGAVVAATGARDLVTDGRRRLWVAGGDPLMARVTGLGCGLSALTAALLAVARRQNEGDRLVAVAAALALYGAAGQAAAERASGPGSFRVAFLDALASVPCDAKALSALISEGP